MPKTGAKPRSTERTQQGEDGQRPARRRWRRVARTIWPTIVEEVDARRARPG